MSPVDAAVGAELEADLSAAASLAAAFAALAAGDLDAIAAIYDACAADLFGLALWRTGSREDAADVVQEVFVRLASGPSGLGRVRNPRAYVLAMGHSAAVDVLRRRKRTVAADDAVLEPVRTDPGTDRRRGEGVAPGPGPAGGAARGRVPAPLRRALVRRDRRRDRRADVHGGEPVPPRDRAAAHADGGGAMNDELFSRHEAGQRRRPSFATGCCGAAGAAAGRREARGARGCGLHAVRPGVGGGAAAPAGLQPAALGARALGRRRDVERRGCGCRGTLADREDRQLAHELGVSPSLMAAVQPPARSDADEELRKLLDDPAFERL